MKLKDLDAVLLDIYYAAGTADARSAELNVYQANTPWRGDEHEKINNFIMVVFKLRRIDMNTVGSFYKWFTDIVKEFDETFMELQKIYHRLGEEDSTLNREYMEHLEYVFQPTRELEQHLHALLDG